MRSYQPSHNQIWLLRHYISINLNVLWVGVQSKAPHCDRNSYIYSRYLALDYLGCAIAEKMVRGTAQRNDHAMFDRLSGRKGELHNRTTVYAVSVRSEMGMELGRRRFSASDTDGFGVFLLFCSADIRWPSVGNAVSLGIKSEKKFQAAQHDLRCNFKLNKNITSILNKHIYNKFNY